MGIETLSLVQALDVWAELVEAYHGQNGYGGTVAEIYSYALESRSPTAEVANQREAAGETLLPTFVEAQQDQARQSREALESMLVLFGQRYDVVPRIQEGAGWWNRYHVEIKREEES